MRQGRHSGRVRRLHGAKRKAACGHTPQKRSPPRGVPQLTGDARPRIWGGATMDLKTAARLVSSVAAIAAVVGATAGAAGGRTTAAERPKGVAVLASKGPDSRRGLTVDAETPRSSLARISVRFLEGVEVRLRQREEPYTYANYYLGQSRDTVQFGGRLLVPAGKASGRIRLRFRPLRSGITRPAPVTAILRTGRRPVARDQRAARGRHRVPSQHPRRWHAEHEGHPLPTQFRHLHRQDADHAPLRRSSTGRRLGRLQLQGSPPASVRLLNRRIIDDPPGRRSPARRESRPRTG